MQLVSASEGLVEIYYTLDLVKSVGCLGKLGLQKVLLGCEHFQVVGISVLHQELGIPHCGLETDDLLLAKFDALLGCLPHREGVVHLHSSVEKTLTEQVASLLVLRLCSLEACLVDATAEARLSKSCKEVCDQTAWSSTMLPLPVVHPSVPLNFTLG